MALVKFDKTIIVKDEYGITRQAFVAGDSVERYVYDAIVATDEVMNPEDLPAELQSGVVETKELPAEEAVADEESVNKGKKSKNKAGDEPA